MAQLLSPLVAIAVAGLALALVAGAFRDVAPALLTVLGAAAVLLLLCGPIAYERVDAHDVLECGSVLAPAGHEPSGLPGDRATACAESYRQRYVFAAVLAGLTAASVGVVAVRRRRAHAA